MTKHRFTVEVLASGQPRAYADTICHVRVSFENVPWNSKDGELVPSHMSEEAARGLLEKMPYAGFTSKTKGPGCEWWEKRLDWLKPIDGKPASEVIPHGDPKQICASVWEFHVTSPYTD